MNIQDILAEQESCQAVIDDIHHQYEMEEINKAEGLEPRPPRWYAQSKYVITCNETRLKALGKQEKVYFEELKLKRHEATMAAQVNQVSYERDLYRDAIASIEDVLNNQDNYGDNPMIRSIINRLDRQLDKLAETGVCE